METFTCSSWGRGWRRRHLLTRLREASPRAAHAEERCAGVGSLTLGNLADRYPMFGVTRPLARRKSLFSRPPRPHGPQKYSDNANRNRLEFTETYPCFSEIRRDNGSHVPENRESPLQKRHRQRIRPCRRGLPRRR